MKNYQLIVFDWEGTLSDPLGAFLAWVDLKVLEYGLAPIDCKFKRQVMSFGLDHAIKKIFPTLSLHQQENCLFEAQSYLAQGAQSYLFPGAYDLLTGLMKHHKQLAIATNKGAQSLQKALEATGIASFFSATRSAGQVPPKPDPQMLEEIMAVLCISAEETLMIGDMVVDVEMANALKVDCIGVDFYYQNKSTLLSSGALYVYDDMMQIKQFLGING